MEKLDAGTYTLRGTGGLFWVVGPSLSTFYDLFFGRECQKFVNSSGSLICQYYGPYSGVPHTNNLTNLAWRHLVVLVQMKDIEALLEAQQLVELAVVVILPFIKGMMAGPLGHLLRTFLCLNKLVVKFNVNSGKFFSINFLYLQWGWLPILYVLINRLMDANVDALLVGLRAHGLAHHHRFV